MRTASFYQALIFSGLLVFVTESAILRPFRRYASLRVPTDLLEDDHLEDGGSFWRSNGDPVYYRPPQISGKFRPNPRRCCQVGERVAQKQMSCDITVLAMLRKYHTGLWLSSQGSSSQTRPDHYNSQYHYQSRLSEKVAKCSAAQPRQFSRCCTTEDGLLSSLKRCQLAAVSRAARRRCRVTFNKRKQKQQLMEH